MRMREIISRKMVQRSPFWLRFALERQQGVYINTTGRFAELATNVKHSSSNNIYTRGMLSIFGERERPNLSAGCMSNAFRRRERNALPFSMVFVSASVHLLIYARTQ